LNCGKFCRTICGYSTMGTRMAKPHIRFLTIVPHFYINIAKLKLI
jgi:hypothetical protein